MSDKKRLEARPSRDDRRIDFQLNAIKAILERPNFDLHCFLTHLKSDTPYSNYQIPINIQEFEFTLKGAFRIEMDKVDQEDGKYRRWRRLFGTTAKEKNGRRANEFKDKPKSWKSRVLFKAFENQERAKDFLSGCPLFRWSGNPMCPLCSSLPAEPAGHLILLQVHDVVLEDKETFALLLKDFLSADSGILALINDCLCCLI